MTEPRRCILCERLFSQSEIDRGIPIQHARRNRILMTRFPSGSLHQFKIEKKQKPQTIPKDAFVTVKPAAPTPETLPEVAVPETAATSNTPDVETLAQALESHFHPVHPVHPELPEQPIENDPMPFEELLDYIVVWVQPDPPPGKRPYGLARPPASKRKERNGVVFRFEDVITEGEETIRPGTKLRGRAMDDSVQKSKRLIDIEVYKETQIE